MIKNVTIIGTGLIGASVALALRAAGFDGEIDAWDSQFKCLDAAYRCGADISPMAYRPDDPEHAPQPGIIVLAGPVSSILDWMEILQPLCGEDTLITDVGSTKLHIAQAAERLYNRPGTARFLPGHPMAGKESGGATLAEASLFEGAMWLFTPTAEETSLEAEWREWVIKFGCRTMDLDPARHDRICAWVSHLPQMVSTAMSAMFEDEFAHAPELAAEFRAIGGRALREMTRLGASPYSMWRDVAHTNTEPLAATIFALEQRLAHLRENLKTPELREEFEKANAFRRER
jgi:prephenate dehydrogenase